MMAQPSIGGDLKLAELPMANLLGFSEEVLRSRLGGRMGSADSLSAKAFIGKWHPPGSLNTYETLTEA